MEIVININNSTYEAIKHEYCAVPPQKGLLKVLWDAIKDGTPLPKGHGRLIDVKQIVYEKDCVWENDGCCTTISTPDIDATPTIIEADKGSEPQENEQWNGIHAQVTVPKGTFELKTGAQSPSSTK